MKRAKTNYAATLDDQQSSGELLILPDGRILAHNITPALARLLTELDPANEAMRQRADLGARAPATAGQIFGQDVAAPESKERPIRSNPDIFHRGAAATQLNPGILQKITKETKAQR